MTPRPAPTTRPKPAVRSTAIRDRHRAIIAKNRPPCALCGSPLDYALVYPDPWCFVVDHIIPIARGGPDALANKQAAHHLPPLQSAQVRPARRRANPEGVRVLSVVSPQ